MGSCHNSEMGMKVGDKICVHFLYEDQLGFDEVPFICTLNEENEIVDGWCLADSDSSGVRYDLDPTQFTLVSDETYD